MQLQAKRYSVIQDRNVFRMHFPDMDFSASKGRGSPLTTEHAVFPEVSTQILLFSQLEDSGMGMTATFTKGGLKKQRRGRSQRLKQRCIEGTLSVRWIFWRSLRGRPLSKRLHMGKMSLGAGGSDMLPEILDTFVLSAASVANRHTVRHERLIINLREIYLKTGRLGMLASAVLLHISGRAEIDTAGLTRKTTVFGSTRRRNQGATLDSLLEGVAGSE